MDVKSVHIVGASMATTMNDSQVYTQAIISRSVPLGITDVGANVAEVIGEHVGNEIEGRCIVEGFVKPGSVKVHSFSAGLLQGASVVYDAAIVCEVCSPVEGEQIVCVAKNVTKAGIRAEIAADPSPVTIFLARDHHHRSKRFSSVTPGETITVSVIGQRFELNDPYVSVIAMLAEPDRQASLPKISIGEEVG